MNGVRLSERLMMVASMVSVTEKVADIGCDHAHTAIYLIENEIAKEVIAMDINEGPVERARQNIELYNCEKYIDVRLSDGAKKLSPKEVNTIIISGMGGRLVEKILSDSIEVVLECDELVLQPQSELFLVRRFLKENGFEIVKEMMCQDEDKYYTAIKAKNVRNNKNELCRDEIPDSRICNSERKPLSYEEKDYSVCEMFGGYLLEHKDRTLHKFLDIEVKKYYNVRETLKKRIAESDCETENYNRLKQRSVDVENRIKKLEGGLKYYEMQ